MFIVAFLIAINCKVVCNYSSILDFLGNVIEMNVGVKTTGNLESIF